jgi:phosphotriesterase-related protein
MHEHILACLPHVAGMLGGEASGVGLFNQPLTLENLGGVRYGRAVNRLDCELTDIETAIAEVGLFRRAGGTLIVDATSIGIGRDPLGLAAVARATGVNVVMGSSFYVESTWPAPAAVTGRSEAEIRDQIVGDLTIGAGDTGVCAGLIGEVGCSWPLTENERKVLRASAAAQIATGAALMVHPGRHSDAPDEIVAVLRDAGANLSRAIICHIDRTIADRTRMKRLAESGCMIEFDLFGMENSYYPWSLPVDMPNDAGRISWLQWLIAEGHGDQLLASHDICFKHQLVKYGGHGYAHILANAAPLMRRKGMNQVEIDRILIENPRRILTIGAQGEHG